MLSSKDGVIKVTTDNGLVLFHTPHVIQVPCDSRIRGVYRIVDIQDTTHTLTNNSTPVDDEHESLYTKNPERIVCGGGWGGYE